jgi:hypothetical protein
MALLHGAQQAWSSTSLHPFSGNCMAGFFIRFDDAKLDYFFFTAKDFKRKIPLNQEKVVTLQLIPSYDGSLK